MAIKSPPSDDGISRKIAEVMGICDTGDCLPQLIERLVCGENPYRPLAVMGSGKVCLYAIMNFNREMFKNQMMRFITKSKSTLAWSVRFNHEVVCFELCMSFISSEHKDGIGIRFIPVLPGVGPNGDLELHLKLDAPGAINYAESFSGYWKNCKEQGTLMKLC